MKSVIMQPIIIPRTPNTSQGKSNFRRSFLKADTNKGIVDMKDMVPIAILAIAKRLNKLSSVKVT